MKMSAYDLVHIFFFTLLNVFSWNYQGTKCIEIGILFSDKIPMFNKVLLQDLIYDNRLLLNHYVLKVSLKTHIATWCFNIQPYVRYLVFEILSINALKVYTFKPHM